MRDVEHVAPWSCCSVGVGMLTKGIKDARNWLQQQGLASQSILVFSRVRSRRSQPQQLPHLAPFKFDCILSAEHLRRPTC